MTVAAWISSYRGTAMRGMPLRMQPRNFGVQFHPEVAHTHWAQSLRKFFSVASVAETGRQRQVIEDQTTASRAVGTAGT